MSGVIAKCRVCSRTFDPPPGTSRRGHWRLCPSCRRPPMHQQHDPPSQCSQCGRELRAGGRDLCLSCALGSSVL
jgi:hypothetical protein